MLHTGQNIFHKFSTVFTVGDFIFTVCLQVIKEKKKERTPLGPKQDDLISEEAEELSEGEEEEELPEEGLDDDRMTKIFFDFECTQEKVIGDNKLGPIFAHEPNLCVAIKTCKDCQVSFIEIMLRMYFGWPVATSVNVSQGLQTKRCFFYEKISKKISKTFFKISRDMFTVPYSEFLLFIFLMFGGHSRNP